MSSTFRTLVLINANSKFDLLKYETQIKDRIAQAVATLAIPN
jgi:hypothetical protein